MRYEVGKIKVSRECEGLVVDLDWDRRYEMGREGKIRLLRKANFGELREVCREW